MNYNEVKKDLRVQVVDCDKFSFFDEVIRRPVGETGLFIVPFYMDQYRVTYVTEDMFAKWEVENAALTPDKVFDDAIEAAMENEPARFNSLKGAINEMFGFGEPYQPIGDQPLDVDPDEFMFLVTNGSRSYGASALLYPEVMSKVAKELGDDYYVLPSSVHEVILVKASEAPDIQELANMVREINSAEVAPDDQLADKVYFFDADAKELKLVAGSELNIDIPMELEGFEFDLEEEEEFEL